MTSFDLQAWLDSAATASGAWSAGGTVRLPRGTYYLSEGLRVPNGVRLVGEGRGATYIVATERFPVDEAMVRLGPGPTKPGNVFGVRLEHLTLQGAGAAGALVYSDQANEQCGIYSCSLLGYRKEGVRIEHVGTAFEIRDCQIFGAPSFEAHAGIVYDVVSGQLVLDGVNTGGGIADPTAQQYGVRMLHGYLSSRVTHGEYEGAHISLAGSVRAVIISPKGHDHTPVLVEIEDAQPAGPGIRDVVVIGAIANNSAILIDDRPRARAVPGSLKHLSFYACKPLDTAYL